MNKAAGILLPITSLPSKYGIGCFSQTAYHFVDWLKKAGGSIIWISLDSDDPATGNWIGFYGPVPDTVWE